MPISCLLQQCFHLLSCLLQVRLVEVLVVEEEEGLLDPDHLAGLDHSVHQREIHLVHRELSRMVVHSDLHQPVDLPVVSNIEPAMEFQEKPHQ